MEGKKADIGKPRLSLVPSEFIEGIARVMTLGAKKYDDFNWAKGMSWSRPFSALLRHTGAWERGENVDPETSESHLLHAACCLLMLYCYQLFNIGTDDRWK